MIASAAPERCDANEIVGACAERYARTGRDVRFAPGPLPPAALRPIAFSRLVTNLIDNALAYGAPPVELSTTPAEPDWVSPSSIASRGCTAEPSTCCRAAAAERSPG